MTRQVRLYVLHSRPRSRLASHRSEKLGLELSNVMRKIKQDIKVVLFFTVLPSSQQQLVLI